MPAAELSHSEILIILALRARIAVGKPMPPTLRELSAASGVSSLSALRHAVSRLARHGLLTREPNLARTIALTPTGLLDPPRPGDPAFSRGCYRYQSHRVHVFDPDGLPK